MLKFYGILYFFFSYCFLKINLDVDIKTFIRTILRHSLVGISSIRGICVIHKHNSEVDFLHFSIINI